MTVQKTVIQMAWMLLVITLWMIAGSSAFAASRADIKRIVIEEATQTKVPPSLALAVAKVESNFNDRALSPAGARGVMQIMPKTARDEFNTSASALWNARTNVRIGVEFLEQLYKAYGERWDLALSHYNGGSLKGSGGNARPHSYTQRYVNSVMKWQKVYEEQVAVWLPPKEGRSLQPQERWREDARIFDQDQWDQQVESNEDDWETIDVVEWRPRDNWRESFEQKQDDWEVVRTSSRQYEEPEEWRRSPPPPPLHLRRGPPPRRGGWGHRQRRAGW